MVDRQTFTAFEQAGWRAVEVGAYERFLAPITGRLVEPLLDAVRATPGERLLDVGCGPGTLAAAAAARGLDAVGLDNAPHLLAHARARHPDVEFVEGSAEELPFPDASFAATVASFVLPHVNDPAGALGEWARVTAPGGRIALTLWNAPSRNRLLGLFLDAMASAGAAPPPDLPAGPPPLDVDVELVALARTRGSSTRRSAGWSSTTGSRTPTELWDGLLTSAVRVPALIRHQDAAVQQRIRAEFDRLVAAHDTGAGLDVPVSVQLLSARR